MPVHVRLVVLLIFGLLFAGIAPAQAAVHPGDELAITVYDHPELSGTIAIDSAGAISIPLIGTLAVQGLEPAQIAARLRDALVAYVRKPAVSVQLKSERPVLFVTGGPGGTLAYEPGETLVAALGALAPRMADAAPTSAATTPQQTASVAELQNARVDLRRVSVQRNGRSLGTYDAVELFARGEGGPQLQAGDTIVLVNKAILVRVSGEVAHPGTAFLSADEPLSDAVSQAGGLLSTATVARMTLTRGGTAHPLAEGDAAWTQPAHAGDAIMVPVAPRVSVAGIVQHPGEFTLRADTTLLSALYQAGGPAKFADVAHVAVVRDGQKTQYNVTRLVKGDLTQNPVLRDGDVVLVPQGRGIDGQAVFQNILSAALLLRPF